VDKKLIIFGTMIGGGCMGVKIALRGYTINADYNYPVMAVKSLTS